MKQNRQQQLEQLGYSFDADVQIWRRPGYQGIAYNDGDEIETRIANAIAGAQDISVLSPDLRQHCIDWASLYHMTSARANLMRPFEHVFASGASVLEVGAGCGAITRYMGECGANVLALEGTPRRAAIARSRTRDLANVTVLSERFNDFAPPVDALFDVITLIGVLEYANLFTPSSNPHLSMLQRVRQLLKPDGVLIIAIENQLGLKYFAGAPEDHLAQPMYGLEGRYQATQPQTFGLVVMKGLLQEAGFVQNQFMSPMPDYKLPTSIVTESGFAHPQFDSSALAWQSARNDPQLPALTNFSLELAWPEIDKNGLAMDMANSFLIAAMPTAGPQAIDASVLAYHYSAGRMPQYCKLTQFVQQNDKVVLYVSRMVAPFIGTVNGELLNQHIEVGQAYTHGELLSQCFVKLVTQDGWTLVQLQDYLETWLAIVQTQAQRFGGDLDLANATVNILLPGECIDCVAQNIILHCDAAPEFIDQEWVSTKPVKLGHLIFRQMLMLLNSVSRFGTCANQHPMTRHDFVQHVYQSLSLDVTDQDLASYNLQEATIQQSVTGTSHERYMDWQPQSYINYQRVHHQNATTLAQRDEQLAQRDEQLAQRDEQLAQRDEQLTDLQTDLHDLHQQNHHHYTQLQLHQASLLWRLTKPVRQVVDLMPQSLRRVLRKATKAAWWTATPWRLSGRLSARRTALSVKSELFPRTDKHNTENTQNSNQDNTSIQIVSPEMVKTWGVLTTEHTWFIANLVAERLSDHGWNVEILLSPPLAFNHDRYIVLCPQMFSKLPPFDKSILYQMEQSVSSRWFTDEYINQLKTASAVLEYSLVNINFLHKKNISYPNIYYMPVGASLISCKSTKDAEDNTDILFYGDSLSSLRRREMLDALIENNYKVNVVNAVFGAEMHKIIQRAKLIINLHYYENALLEMPRIQECLSLGVPVISESACDQGDYPELTGAVIFFEQGSITEMLKAVKSVLENGTDPSNIEKSVSMSNARFKFMFDRFLVGMDFLPSASIKETVPKLPNNSQLVALSLPETIQRRKTFLASRPANCLVFDGIRKRTGWIGCGLSYSHIAQRALESELSRIAIMEDDVLLPSDFEKKLELINRYLDTKQGQWDIFSGIIADANKNLKILNVEVFEEVKFVTINKMTSMVFNIYNESALKIISNWNSDNGDTENTIDRYLENHANIRIIVALPYLVGHREDLNSTLWGFNNKKYIDMIVNSEKLLNELTSEYEKNISN